MMPVAFGVLLKRSCLRFFDGGFFLVASFIAVAVHLSSLVVGLGVCLRWRLCGACVCVRVCVRFCGVGWMWRKFGLCPWVGCRSNGVHAC